MSPLGRTQTLSAGDLVMPHNKALQLTANPLRGLPAAELGRSAAEGARVAKVNGGHKLCPDLRATN
jgi:hypothetical protein